MSAEDIRAPDNSFNDQLIGSFEQNLTDDDEINQAIQASLETANQEFERQMKQKKFDGQINSLNLINQEELRLQKFKEEKLKEELIEQRESEFRSTIVFLSRLKLTSLLELIQNYIQSGIKIDYEHYESFKKELKPSLFENITHIFKDEPFENYDEDDEYEYEE